MKVQRREQQIISLLETHKEISVAELSRILDCSVSTIRKQLAVMEEAGLLIRTYGGAKAIDRFVDESFESKRYKSISEKHRIAEKARTLIPEGAAIALGSGTTVYALATLLDNQYSGTVYTNSMQSADFLSHCQNLEVHLSCGVVRGHTGTIIGHEVKEYFEGLGGIDCAFIGCDAIDENGNIFNDNLAVAAAEQALLLSAKKRFILCDSTKFGKRSTARIANLRDCDGLITCSAPNVLLTIYRGLTEIILG